MKRQFAVPEAIFRGLFFRSIVKVVAVTLDD